MIKLIYIVSCLSFLMNNKEDDKKFHSFYKNYNTHINHIRNSPLMNSSLYFLIPARVCHTSQDSISFNFYTLNKIVIDNPTLSDSMLVYNYFLNYYSKSCMPVETNSSGTYNYSLKEYKNMSFRYAKKLLAEDEYWDLTKEGKRNREFYLALLIIAERNYYINLSSGGTMYTTTKLMSNNEYRRFKKNYPKIVKRNIRKDLKQLKKSK